MRRRSRLLAGALVCVAASLQPLTGLQAAEAERREHDLQIERQPLARALQEFARQSGIQIIFFSSITEGREAAPLHGRFTTEAALHQMLDDTRLTFREIHPNTIQICLRTSAPCAPAANTPEPPQSKTETEMQIKQKESAEQSRGSRRAEAVWAALVAGSSAFGVSSVARAQGADGRPEPLLEEVVVTGSRVISNGNNSPTPLTAISTDQLLEVQPTSVAAALQNLPVFQGSLGQGTGTGGSGAGPNGSANAVNIRNLGFNRTLVLFDGNRLQPTTDTGVVTLDMVPQMLLQRVDVVTGGVSAVYGSDAISGVVNLITDKSFNGLKFKAQSGVSEVGDGEITDLGVAAGTALFGGRGHIEGSFEYFNDEGIFDMSSRQVGNNYVLVGTGTANSPYTVVSDARLANTSFGGLIRSGAGSLNGYNFTGNGMLYPFRPGTATATNTIQIGGDGGYYFNTSLKSSLRSRRAFGRFDFDVTGSTHFYVEAAGAKYSNAFQNQTLSLNDVVLSKTNAFLPTAYQTTMLQAAGTTFTLSKIPQQLGPHRSEFEMESYQAFAGLEGEIGKYKWDVSLSHGKSTPTWNTLRNRNTLKTAAALDAVLDTSTGQIVCRATLTNPAAFPGCKPLNLFGPTAESAAALAYITDYTVSSATSSQDEVTAAIAGAPLSTWAGPINMALSGEWRESSFSTISEVPPTELANCALLPNTMNCTATTVLHQVTFRAVDKVKQSVTEAAVEADLPLLKGVILADSLNLNLAARHARYDVGFNSTTWKAGLDWHLNGEWRIRATRSRDFRAPTLNDLNAPATISRGNFTNEWTGAQLTNFPVQGGGNPDLQPEIGDTWTAGVVYQPNWWTGFSLSVDAYDIKITHAFAGENGSATATQRRCRDSGGTSPYCELIVRNPATNEITLFYNRTVNAASTTTHGLDIEMNYNTRLFDRPLSLRVLGTWQPELRTVTLLTDIDQSGSAGTPEWRATAFLNYSMTDQFRVGLSHRWRSAVKWGADPLLVYAEPKVPSFSWTNLNLTFAPNLERAEVEFYANVQNLFDKKPPVWTNSTVNPGVFGAYVRTDDFVGRYYTAGVRVKL